MWQSLVETFDFVTKKHLRTMNSKTEIQLPEAVPLFKYRPTYMEHHAPAI